MKVLFLDESGDHNLDKIDPQYPVFVLGGVIVDRDHVTGVLTQRMNELKISHFSDPEVILHTSDIARNRGAFSKLSNQESRDLFISDLGRFMEDADVQVIACIIDKREYKTRYGSSAYDPYQYALQIVLERFVKEVGDVADGGIIVAERRGNPLDNALEREWMRITRDGAGYLRPSRVNKRIVDLVLRDKSLNITGLQLADLVVSPIARHALGKDPKNDWAIVESKLCKRASGDYEGFGIVRLPKKRG